MATGDHYFKPMRWNSRFGSARVGPIPVASELAGDLTRPGLIPVASELAGDLALPDLDQVVSELAGDLTRPGAQLLGCGHVGRDYEFFLACSWLILKSFRLWRVTYFINA